ncbi:uncharacterized protein LOC126655433 [Mercurialis annua]|uniref:uncharacterized protein LOC126655433 n=1 Tax=Mercurialis annua TaxID=3986 RepID=UPI00215F83FB|nr:uncharacterized protein LOC126655433 [Mercurialis annua]
MGKPESETTSCCSVFIDTSLNTHFATFISPSDTVSDLKERIIQEHSSGFPKFGDIKIHALKVKRKGCFYQLSDKMLATSVFHGIDKCWFVTADVSSSVKEEHDVDDVGYNRPLKLKAISFFDDRLSSDLDVVHGNRGLEIVEIGVECSGGNNGNVKPLDVDNCDKENEIEGPIGGRKRNARDEISDDVQGDAPAEIGLDSRSRTKKKRKSEKKVKYAKNDLGLKEDALVPDSDKNVSQQEIVVSVVSCDEATENRNTIGDSSGAVQETAVASTEGTVVLEKPVELESDKLRSDVNMQCDKSVEENLQSEPMAKKKRKIKKHKDGKEGLLKSNGALIAEPNEDMVELLAASEHSLQPKQYDKNNIDGSNVVVQETAVASAEVTAVLEKHVELESDKLGSDVNTQCDKSVEDNMQSEPVAKKKRKIKKRKDGKEDSLKNNGALIAESNKEMVELLDASEHSLLGKQDDRSNIDESSGVVQETVVASAEVTAVLEKHVELKSEKLRSDINTQCDKLVEDNMQSEPVTKKRRKVKERKDGKEDPLKNNGALIAESNKEMVEPLAASEHSLLAKQDNRNPSLSSSTEIPEDVHLLSAGSSNGKKKKKKPTDTFNQDTDLGNLDASNVDSRCDASRLAVKSDSKSMKVSEDCPSTNAVHLEVRESDNTEKAVEISRNENDILGDDQNAAVNHKNGVEEQNLALNISPVLDDLASAAKVLVSPKLAEAGEIMSPLKSSKKRKKSKKTNELSEKPSVSVVEHNDGSGTSPMEPHDSNVNNNGGNLNKGENNVPMKGGKVVSEMETSASLLVTAKEIDDIIQNTVESVQQVGQVEVSGQNMDGKSKKKTKKKRISNLPEWENDTKVAGNVVSAPSADNNTRQAENSSNDQQHIQNAVDSVKQFGQVEVSGENMDGKSKKKIKKKRISNLPESKNNTGNIVSAPSADNNTREAEYSSNDQQHKMKSNNEGLEAVVNKNPSENGHADDNLETESNEINFKNYFVPGQHNHENVSSGEVLADSATKAKEVDGKIKAKKKKKKLDPNSHSTSLDLQSSQSLNESYKVEARPSKVSDGVVKTPPFSKSDKARQSVAVKPSSTISHANSKRAALNPSLESSKDASPLSKRVNGTPNEDNNRMNSKRTSTGEVVNNAQHKDSLTGVSGSILKKDDEAFSNKDDNSDSTRTPSDKSLSSDYSDGESNAESNLTQNGLNSWKRKHEGGKTPTMPLISGMALDAILRSSSRYKKAKITATLSQLEETESQAAEVVPDSQANP